MCSSKYQLCMCVCSLCIPSCSTMCLHVLSTPCPDWALVKSSILQCHTLYLEWVVRYMYAFESKMLMYSVLAPFRQHLKSCFFVVVFLKKINAVCVCTWVWGRQVERSVLVYWHCFHVCIDRSLPPPPPPFFFFAKHIIMWHSFIWHASIHYSLYIHLLVHISLQKTFFKILLTTMRVTIYHQLQIHMLTIQTLLDRVCFQLTQAYVIWSGEAFYTFHNFVSSLCLHLI